MNVDCPICGNPINPGDHVIGLRFGKAGQAFQIDVVVHGKCLWDMVKNPVKDRFGPFVSSIAGKIFGGA